MDKKRGSYLGTEIEEKWWKRYMKHRLFARGNGEYWVGTEGFYFRRHLTREPILIPFGDILEIKLGNWHAGRWCMGKCILKIVWRKDGRLLSSGFLVSKDEAEVLNLKAELERNIGS